MKKLTAVILSLLVIALIFSGCYFSAVILPSIGETNWVFAMSADGDTATGTLHFDKRKDFDNLIGSFNFEAPEDASPVKFNGEISKHGKIWVNPFIVTNSTGDASITLKFEGTLNDAENRISGSGYATETAFFGWLVEFYPFSIQATKTK